MPITSTRVSHPTNKANYSEVTLYSEEHTLTVAYSYETPIGFQCSATNNGAPVSRRNDWGPTTGRHIQTWHPGNGGDRDRGPSGPRGFLALLSEAFAALTD